MDRPTSPQVVVPKKVSNMVWMVFFMIRNRVTKSKLMANLQRKVTKCCKATLKHLMFHQNHSTPTTFLPPKEYEFSCSTTPAHHFFNNNGKHPRTRYFSPAHSAISNHVKGAVTNLEKILEMLDSEMAEASPVLSVFGNSPRVRQVRITDSPFPLQNIDTDSHVNEDAEEFIERFYAQLRLQMKMINSEAGN